MTVRPEDDPVTGLAARLRQLIADNGPLSVGDFMADALGHPQFGYYSTRDPFGTAGDFTTAPEISQMFGELVGAFLIDAWEAIGAPSHFQLVELGPGRGTLMKDVLRTGKLRPKFLDAARITLVEQSGRLRHTQGRTLWNAHPHLGWTQSFGDVPEGPMIVVANEFFDCLPIRQFVKVAADDRGGWRERRVGSDGDGQFVFVLGDEPHDLPPLCPPRAPLETVFETSPVSTQLVAEMAGRLKRHKGRVLVIDYGYDRPGWGDTFQAVKRHDFYHPLNDPGTADITAHVDFAALARAGKEAGADVAGPVPQGQFLHALGLPHRAEALARSADDPAAIRAAAHRLASPGEMGDLFKVLCLSSPSRPRPPGFA